MFPLRANVLRGIFPQMFPVVVLQIGTSVEPQESSFLGAQTLYTQREAKAERGEK